MSAVFLLCLGQRLFHQFLIFIKQLLFLLKPFKPLFRKILQRFHTFKNIVTQQRDDFTLLQNQPGYFAVDAPDNIHTAFKVSGSDHLFKKNLLDAYLTLILRFFCVQIKGNPVRRNRITDLTVPVAALNEPCAPRLHGPAFRIKVIKNKGPAFVGYFIEYVLNQFPDFLRILCQSEISEQKLPQEIFIPAVNHSRIVKIILFNKKPED